MLLKTRRKMLYILFAVMASLMLLGAVSTSVAFAGDCDNSCQNSC